MNYELMQEANVFKPADKVMWQKYKIAKRTLDVLIEYSDDDGDTFVGIKTIAKRLLVSNQTVINHFEILKKLEILTIQKVGGRAIKSIKISSKVSSTQGSSEGSTQGSKVSSKVSSSEGSNGLECNKENRIKEGIEESTKVSPPSFSKHVRMQIRDNVFKVFNKVRKTKKISLPIALNKLNHAHYATLYSRFKDAKSYVEDLTEDDFPIFLEDLMIFKFKQSNFFKNDSVTFNTFTYKSNFEKYVEEFLGAE